MKKLIYVSLVLITVCSCLSRDFSEPNPYLLTDTGSLTVLSDIDFGKVRDTLYITSNRSWSAVFSEDVSWAKMEVAGCENISGISKITALPLQFEDNESDQPRSVDVLICAGSLKEKVTLVQEAKSYRLVLSELPSGIDAISADGGSFDISFICNTDWTARVDHTDGMLVGLSAEQGSRSASVTVTVQGNTDQDKERTAVVTLSAKGCFDIDVLLTQKKWTPYFELADKQDVNVKDGVNGYTVPFKTNLKWTAEIVSVENYDAQAVKLSSYSGTASAKGVNVIFPGCVAFGHIGKIVVRFNPEGLPSQTLTLYQEPSIRISFATPSKEANWPFVTPAFSEFTKSSTTAIYKKERTEFVLPNGYKLHIYSTKGFWLNTKTGFMGGGTAGDYIELPVVEGRCPVRIEYKYLGSAPLSCRVCGEDGVALSGSSFRTGPQGSVTSVNLNGTVPTDVYRIVTINTQHFQLDDLVIYYE